MLGKCVVFFIAHCYTTVVPDKADEGDDDVEVWFYGDDDGLKVVVCRD